MNAVSGISKAEEEKMFSFGKGILKVELKNKQKERQIDGLGAIPEKLRQHGSRMKRTADSEANVRTKNKHKGSVLKLKECKKGTVV